MNKILYAPILNIMEERRNVIDGNYKLANDCDEKSQGLVAEKEEKIAKNPPMAGFCLLLLSKREAGLGGVAFRIAAGRYADGERATGAKGVHADFSKRGGQGYVFQSEAHVESPLADGF